MKGASRSRCSTMRLSRTYSEKTPEACGAKRGDGKGDGASRAESAAGLRAGGLDRSTLRYQRKRSDAAAPRQRLRELAAELRRFGYRRLGWTLAREGQAMNHKRFSGSPAKSDSWCAGAEGANVRSGPGRPMTLPAAINQRWSLDFVGTP
jgi:hypothetical protein